MGFEVRMGMDFRSAPYSTAHYTVIQKTRGWCLASVLERVAEIRKNELRKWYGQDRISVNVWRDIEEKWHEVLRGEDYDESQLASIPLLLVGDSAGLFVFVYGSNLQTIDPADKAEGWLWPISDWMKAKDRRPATNTD